jgi:hypothetical protein
LNKAGPSFSTSAAAAAGPSSVSISPSCIKQHKAQRVSTAPQTTHTGNNATWVFALREKDRHYSCHNEHGADTRHMVMMQGVPHTHVG